MASPKTATGSGGLVLILIILGAVVLSQQPNSGSGTKHKEFPGNVGITLYWEQAQKQTVVVFDYGQGAQHKTGNRPGGHWDATVKPNQAVHASVVPAHPGERGYIHLYIVQQNNGRKICDGSNKATDSNGGGDCGGVVII